jgi:hypothetical protein
MIVDSVDAIFIQASENIGFFIDAFVDAALAGAPKPQFKGIEIPASVPPKKQLRKPRRKIAVALADILDNVEEAFESANLPHDKWASLPKDTARALRKLGPWVPFVSPWDFGDGTRPKNIPFEMIDRLPGMFYLSRGRQDEKFDGFDLSDNEGYGLVAFACGEKLNKTPWYVEQKDGVCYFFWLAFRYKKKLQWIDATMVICPKTGKVSIARQLHAQMIPINSGHAKGHSYPRKLWYAPMVDEASCWGKTTDERSSIACGIFIRILEWWDKRDDRWIASVRRGDQRVTFSVEQHLTRHFFRDRDKTITTPSGSRKKIIHFVNAHNRNIGEKIVAVKAHIRGIRSFDWRGFTCSITAPEFHKWTINQWTVGAEDAEDIGVGKAAYTFPQMAKFLSDLEDTQTVPIYPRAHTVTKNDIQHI